MFFRNFCLSILFSHLFISLYYLPLSLLSLLLLKNTNKREFREKRGNNNNNINAQKDEFHAFTNVLARVRFSLSSSSLSSLLLFSIKRIVEFFESFISLLFPIERDDANEYELCERTNYYYYYYYYYYEKKQQKYQRRLDRRGRYHANSSRSKRPVVLTTMVLECLCTPSWCVIFLFFLNFEPNFPLFFVLSPSLSPQKTEN